MSLGVLANNLRGSARAFSAVIDLQSLHREKQELDQLHNLENDQEASQREHCKPIGRLLDVGALDICGGLAKTGRPWGLARTVRDACGVLVAIRAIQRQHTAQVVENLARRLVLSDLRDDLGNGVCAMSAR
jgi:hypothetical protein